jgi:hypothetical protein
MHLVGVALTRELNLTQAELNELAKRSRGRTSDG